MTTANDLRERRAGAWAVAQDFNARHKAGEKLSTADQLRWERALEEVEVLTNQIDTAEIAEGFARADDLGARISVDGPTGQRTVVDRETPLTRDQSVTEWSRKFQPDAHRDAPDLNLAKLLRGMATGNWEGAAAEHRAMAEGAQSAGGALVPTPLASEVIDLARNQTRVVQAGARTVPMDSQTIKIARVATDPTASWKIENATASESSPTMDSITLTAQTLMVFLRVSLELVEDAPNTGDVVRHIIAAAIAQEWDRVALRGAGSAPEPQGIRSASGVTVSSPFGNNGGTPTNHDFLIDGFQTLRAINYEPTGVILSPRTETTLAKLKDSTGQPLRQPEAVAAIPRYSTNQIQTTLTKGTSSNCSDAYIGQWDQLFLGTRTDLRIMLLQERFMDAGQYGFVAYLRGDIGLARAGAFTVLEGIRP